MTQLLRDFKHCFHGYCHSAIAIGSFEPLQSPQFIPRDFRSCLLLRNPSVRMAKRRGNRGRPDGFPINDL
jgi:hypothetical protein